MASIRSRKHSTPVHLLALLAASVPAAGMAQQTTTLPTVTVKEAADVPYKADTSANDKMTAPLVDTPKTIQIIKKEVLEEQGAVTLMEALRNTPGITMQMGENGNTATGGEKTGESRAVRVRFAPKPPYPALSRELQRFATIDAQVRVLLAPTAGPTAGSFYFVAAAPEAPST